MDQDLQKLEKEGIEHLEKIEDELEEIKIRTGGGRWVWMRNGFYQGIGVIVGSIVGVILLGFILSALGVIPGFSDVVGLLRDAADKVRRY